MLCLFPPLLAVAAADGEGVWAEGITRPSPICSSGSAGLGKGRAQGDSFIGRAGEIGGECAVRGGVPWPGEGRGVAEVHELIVGDGDAALLQGGD